jgi:hypothetical protein
LDGEIAIPNSLKDSNHRQKRSYQTGHPPKTATDVGSAGRNNLSKEKICKCEAETTPTFDNNGRVAYRIFSFGCNSRHFASSQRLHERLRDLAVQRLEDGVLVAVRVGSDSQFAILAKDADGTVRSCVGTIGPRRDGV